MAPITPAQIRGARGMLGWSMAELAKAAGVSISSVKRMEEGGVSMVSPTMLGQIQSAFEAAEVELLADDGNGPGIRLRSRQPSAFFRLL